MEQLDYEWELREILEEIPGYDPDFKIVHHASWSSYEEHAWMFILSKDAQLYAFEYHYSVMAEDNSVCWDPYPVTTDQALELMIEWEEAVEEMERLMSL